MSSEEELIQEIKGQLEHERQNDNDPRRVHRLEGTLRFIDRDFTNDDTAMDFFEKETGFTHPYKCVYTNREAERNAAWAGWEACAKYFGQKQEVEEDGEKETEGRAQDIVR